jgi:hypothetical protein
MASFSRCVHFQMRALEGAGSRATFGDRNVTTCMHSSAKRPLLVVFAFVRQDYLSVLSNSNSILCIYLRFSGDNPVDNL